MVVRGLMKHGRIAYRPSTTVLDGTVAVDWRSNSTIRALRASVGPSCSAVGTYR